MEGLVVEAWIHRDLKANIGEKRYKHSLLVSETSMELAKVYGASVEAAKIAGLLHDCGKFQDKTKILKRAQEFDIILDNIMKNNIQLIHGPLGAALAKYKYKVDDKDILNAIYYHTTARENMSLLEKIVFIADLVEPSRSFPNVDKMRELVYKDLNKALIFALENNIKIVIEKNHLLHLDTIKARNYLLTLEDLE